MKLKYWLLLSLGLLLAPACEKKETPTPEAAEEKADEKTGDKAEEKAPEAKAEEANEDDGGNWVQAAKYGVKFRVPAEWKVSQTEDAVSATAEDGSITIIMVGTGSEAVFETAMASISQEVKFTEMKTEKSSMTVINGLAGFQGAGSAVLELESGPQEFQFLGYALRVNQENAVAVMVFAEAEMYEARKEELEGIIKTVQKS